MVLIYLKLKIGNGNKDYGDRLKTQPILFILSIKIIDFSVLFWYNLKKGTNGILYRLRCIYGLFCGSKIWCMYSDDKP